MNCEPVYLWLSELTVHTARFSAGSEWITGTAQYVLDPTDPYPAGFLL